MNLFGLNFLFHQSIAELSDLADHRHNRLDHRHGGSDHRHSEPDHRHNRQGMLPSGAEGVRFCGTPSATRKDKTLLHNLLQNSAAEGGQ